MSDELDRTRPQAPASDADVADRLLRVVQPVRNASAEAALIDRIVAAAERTPRLALPERAAETVTTPPQRSTAVRPPLHAIGPPAAASAKPLSTRWRTQGGAAGLMAASLLVGFLLGQTPGAGEAVRGFEAATGLSVAAVTLETVAAEISEE